MSKENGANPALELAKEVTGKDTNIVDLPGGIQVQVLPVSATLMDEVTSRVVDPEPPMFMNEQKGREEPNPLDPSYIKQLEANERRRQVAVMDIMTMFGVELLSGMPESDEWIKKLQMMEKLGHLDLSGYDFEDELDKEFVYKRFIVLSATLIGKIGSASGLTEEEVKKAEDSFQSN
jgi:hypothetical protein